jgi:hypothetical protein
MMSSRGRAGEGSKLVCLVLPAGTMMVLASWARPRVGIKQRRKPRVDGSACVVYLSSINSIARFLLPWLGF